MDLGLVLGSYAAGVMDSNSATTTTALGGVFKTQPDTRTEFLMATL